MPHIPQRFPEVLYGAYPHIPYIESSMFMLLAMQRRKTAQERKTRMPKIQPNPFELIMLYD